jgi:thioredoxin-like negative regulator of GroEL
MQYDMFLWEEFVQSKDAVLLYLHNDTCGVCNTLHPKVKELVDTKFPNIEMVDMDAVENRELAAQLRMLSIPGIVFYAMGKEVFRANGMISLGELEQKIARPYSLMFE